MRAYVRHVDVAGANYSAVVGKIYSPIAAMKPSMPTSPMVTPQAASVGEPAASEAERTARYRVETIRYYVDPPDMWSATLIFAPREGTLA